MNLATHWRLAILLMAGTLGPTATEYCAQPLSAISKHDLSIAHTPRVRHRLPAPPAPPAVDRMENQLPEAAIDFRHDPCSGFAGLETCRVGTSSNRDAEIPSGSRAFAPAATLLTASVLLRV